jgi:HlyD family secretion protein
MDTLAHPTDRIRHLPWWQRQRTRRIGFVGIIVSLTILVGLLIRQPDSSARVGLKSLSLATVETGTFHDYVALRPRVTALNTVYLDAQAGGRVERVLARAGDMVADGQVLLELSNSQWELDVLEREARVVESISQLESYQTQLEQNRIANQRSLAQIDYDVMRLRRSLSRRKALANSAEPIERVDQVEDELGYDLKIQPLQDESNRRQEQLRVEQIPQIREQLQKLQQDLRMTHAQLEKLTVRSPVAGQLTALSAKVGENRSAGERFGQVTPNGGFKLVASLDEYYLGKVQTAQEATISIRDRDYAAKVERVYPEVKDNVFTIDLLFSDTTPADLTSGEDVEGRLSLGADRDTLILASGPFLEQTNGQWAFVLDPSANFARRRPIKIGRRNLTQLEVIGGVTVGERIVISSYERFGSLDRLNLTQKE